MLKILLLLYFGIYTILSANEVYLEAIKIKKIYPMGKKIYRAKCKTIDLNKYSSIEEMQNDIESNHLCKNLKKKYFQALSLYLWEVKRVKKELKVLPTIKVTHKEKCPICGMFVYKYPRWAAQIFYEDKHYSFDGMKDLMKWYFENKKGITQIITKDYYSQKSIDATKAFYVFGSDIYGPMGNELIAFKTLQQAKIFSLDHKGKKVLFFENITENEVYKLDE